MALGKHVDGIYPLVLGMAFWVCLMGSQAMAQDSVSPDLPPATAAELVEAGRVAFVQKDFAGAGKHFESFLETFSESPEAAEAVRFVRPLYALCLVRERAFGEAAALIELALADQALEASVRQELTFWKGVVALQEGDYSVAQEVFLRYYQNGSKQDPRRYEAAVLFGNGYLLQEQFEQAVTFLEQAAESLRPESPQVAARLVCLHLHALLQLERLDDAWALVKTEIPRFHDYIQIIGLQSQVLDLGSRLLEAERYQDAVACFHQVWEKERLIRLQQEREAKLDERLKILGARGDADALVFQLEGLRKRIIREREQFEKVTEYDAALRLRLARAYMGLDRYREAGMVLEAILLQLEPTALVEGASVNLMQCWLQTDAFARAVRSAELYENRFGEDGPNAATIMFLKGQALQSDRLSDEAIMVFDKLLERFPESPMAANAFFMRGMCHLQEERYDEAIGVFSGLLNAYPQQKALAESALYWEGMAYSFDGEHARCLEKMRAHLENYPQGYYHQDVVFREAFSLQALADYASAIEGFAGYLAMAPDGPYADEAKLLQGDAYFATGDLEKGMIAYEGIRSESTRFFEDGYFKIGKALRMSERFDEMEGHFQRFCLQHADSARLPEAVQWLGWLKQREGDLEGARTLYWKTIDLYGNDPNRTSVESLWEAMVKLYQGAEGRAVLDERLVALEAAAKDAGKTTLQLRCLWARGLLWESQKTRALTYRMQATRLAQVERDPVRILADGADAERIVGDLRNARELYEAIRKWHPISLERIRAEAGLGFLALAVGDHAKARDHFRYVEKHGKGSTLVGPVSLALASTYYRNGEREEALAAINALLADGLMDTETKARALVQGGEWLAADGDLKESLVYFERVYLVYGRYHAEVARAYWNRGQVLEKLEMPEAAREVYEEMMSRSDLKPFEEFRKAEKRLNEWPTAKESEPSSNT